MRPTRAGADLGPAPGPRITCLRSVGPNLPATPVGASSRSGRLRSPSGPGRSGSIRRSHPGRGFPSARPLLEVGGSFRLPGEMEPASDPGHRIPGARRPGPERAPCARSTHRLLGAGLAAMSSADRSSGPGPILTGLRLTDRVDSRSAARLGRSTSWGLKSAASTRNAKSPALSPESGRNPHPAPGFPHLCPHLRPRSTITRRPANSPAQPSPGGHSLGQLDHHPAAGQQPRSIITRRRVSGRSVMIPSTPKSKRRCISPGSSMVQT